MMRCCAPRRSLKGVLHKPSDHGAAVRVQTEEQAWVSLETVDLEFDSQNWTKDGTSELVARAAIT